MGGPVYNCVWLVCGTLYPAYSSFKAVKAKNAKLYVRWMMYWIVYAVYAAIESILDPFLNFWLPLYAEAKIIFLLYLVSSSTRGSSVIYKSWLHPLLSRNETEIDVAIEKFKIKSFQTVKNWMKLGFQKVGGFVTKTALSSGGGLVQQLQRSYSMIDLSNMNDFCDSETSTDQSEKETKDNYQEQSTRLRHYKSEESLSHLGISRSSLRSWKSPEMFTSNTSISSGYSTDSLLPTFEEQDTGFDETSASHYEAIQLRAKDIMRREAQLDEILLAKQRKRRFR